ncbi:MAG: type II toxin-antitoxin system RelE/ParE family toxin [Firmicutes bacterium]|nr:type II toxin-antitoxin system RelE/ParE family toxin [Bacillota bacterium]
MQNKYDYKFTSLAERDLYSALEYIELQLKNPKAAKDLVIQFYEKLDLIREFPNSGAPVHNEYILDQSLRRFFVGNYTCFYKADEKTATIIIVRVVYGARDMDEVLKNT